MTVNTDLGRVQYNGNDVTTAFAFASRILNAAHLKVITRVIATGVETTLVLNTDYTVAGVGDASCTVNTTSPVASGTTITISRSVPLTQSADYVENDPFPAETHENALDKLTMITQQLAEVDKRALKFPETVATSIDGILPVPQDNYLLVWDGVTGKIKNSSTSFGDIEANLTIVVNNIADVNTVAGSIANVNIVAANDGDISTVAADITNINTVAGSIASVNIVAADIANVNTVATDIASVNSAAANMAAIIAAPTHATNAANSAGAAAASETISYKWANEAEDVVVAGGQYSAYHWAQKAAAAAQGQAINISTDPTGMNFLTGADLETTKGQTDQQFTDTNVADGLVRLDPAGALPALDGSALTGILPLLHIQDQKSAGTNGGTATSGSWQTRTLNTELTDEIGSTLSSNEFTLPAGTYLIMAQAPATRCNQHQARLYNVTDAAVVMYGTSGTVSSTSGTGGNSFINGVFTISGQKTFRIEHRVNTTQATNGYGEANSFGGTQVYTDVKVWKK